MKYGKNPKLTIIEDLSGKIKVKITGGPAWLVIRDWFSPGWQCADPKGKKVSIINADGGLLGVFADKKNTVLSLSYSPPGLKAGLITCLLGIALVLSGFGMYCQRPENEKVKV